MRLGGRCGIDGARVLLSQGGIHAAFQCFGVSRLLARPSLASTVTGSQALFVAMSETKTVLVTKQFVHSGKTAAGGWTASQLNLIGVEWPPESGWINRAEGNEISKADADTFLEIGRQSYRKLRAR